MEKRLPKKKTHVMLRVFKTGDRVLFDLKGRRTCKLNEVAVIIWSLCDGSHSLGDITNVILDEYDLDKKKAENDVKGFIDRLLSLDFIEI